MEFDDLNSFLLEKPGTKLEQPFGSEVLVYKVLGKMYALVSWQAQPLLISLKCDPQQALELRKRCPSIKPGYHLNKMHWNTVTLDNSIPDNELIAMINESFRLVVASMPKRLVRTLAEIAGKEKTQKKEEAGKNGSQTNLS